MTSNNQIKSNQTKPTFIRTIYFFIRLVANVNFNICTKANQGKSEKILVRRES